MKTRTMKESPVRHAAAGSEINLGARVRALRRGAGLTIKDVAESAGLSPSSISKIENSLLSPTYENVIRLARGLGVDIAELFSETPKALPHGRRSITRSGEGRLFRSQAYDYEMLCNDLVSKKMVPIRARIRVRDRKDFSHLLTHEGEEVLLILSGTIELHTEFYEPVVLESGDCAYFDSTMGHFCVAKGLKDADVFWVCSSSEVISLVEHGGGPKASR